MQGATHGCYVAKAGPQCTVVRQCNNVGAKDIGAQPKVAGRAQHGWDAGKRKQSTRQGCGARRDIAISGKVAKAEVQRKVGMQRRQGHNAWRRCNAG